MSMYETGYFHWQVETSIKFLLVSHIFLLNAKLPCLLQVLEAMKKC